MDIIERLNELNESLELEGYKGWSYARLAASEAIKEINLLREEAKELHRIAEFWQNKYNEQNKPHNLRIDNNPIA